MDSDTKGMVFIFAIIAVMWISLAYIFEYKPQQPTPTPMIHNQPPIGYNLGQVGKDSVLTIKGQFVRQVGDRVMVKIK